MPSRRFHPNHLAFVLCFALSLSLAVQPMYAADSASDEPSTKVAVQVNVVNVFATVRDKKGAVIHDLKKDDFALTEDGRPQDIRYFSKETDLPLTLGLLVDTSLSQRRVLDQERTASQSFLDHMLRADRDKAFLIHFDHEVELLQDLTSSREKLQTALDSLHTPQLERASTQSPGSDPDDRHGGHGGGGHHHMSGGTLLYDAVFLASDELTKKQQGRKALIILSDGVDRGSKETLEYAMETAQRADTIVYSILFKDDEAYQNHERRGGYGGPMGGPIGGPMGGPMGGPVGGHRGGGRPPQQESHVDGKKVLEQISKQTGGRLFEVSKKESVDQIYAQIEEELRSQYSLGYTPVRGDGAPESYHKIQVTTKKKDLIVQARDGYYSRTAQ